MRMTLFGLALAVIALAVVGCATEPEPQVTPAPQPVVTPVLAVDATPTVGEALREFTQCARLIAKKSLAWGQAPGVIYSGNPTVTGRIEQGDYVRFVTKPNADGKVRVQVEPHDSRTVGTTDNQVWIDWTGLTRLRSDQFMFECED